jgi:hypothetical protein
MLSIAHSIDKQENPDKIENRKKGKIHVSVSEQTQIDSTKKIIRKDIEPKKRIYPDKTSAELVDFGWKQFQEENYEHAAECFKELVTRRDSLADAYLGLGWSKLMLYEPIEETRILKSGDFVKNKEFYAVLPDEMYLLYTEKDNCPQGWVGNAIKLYEDGNPQLIDPESMPLNDDMFPLITYIDPGIKIETSKVGTGIEIGGDPEKKYSFYLSSNASNASPINTSYNSKTGIMTILDKYTDYLKGDFNDYVIGVTYLNAKNGRGYWSGEIEIDPRRDSENSLFSFIRYDSTCVKIIKRKNQNHKTDTWNYQVFNLNDFGEEVNRPRSKDKSHLLNEEAFSIDIYRTEKDGTKNRIVPGTDMTYLEYLKLDTNNDGIVNEFDKTLDLKGNKIRFPFIKPFAGLGDEDIYTKEQILQEKQISIALNLRYVDYMKFLEISEIFSNAKKYLINKEYEDIYNAGKCYYWIINKTYHGFFSYTDDLVKNKWELPYKSNFNYQDLIIIRAYSYLKLQKYDQSLAEIHRLEPDFKINLTNEDEINVLQEKIEELVKTLEIKIK